MSGAISYYAAVSVRNLNHRPVTLTLQVPADGRNDDGQFQQTIPPQSEATIAGVLKCNGMTAGTHTAYLQLTSSRGSVVVHTATLLAVFNGGV